MSKRKVLLMGKSGAGKTSMRSIIFANYIARDTSRLGPTIEVLIYVFDVESRECERDYNYFQTCLEALLINSPNAEVFCLVHKMDLIQEEHRERTFEEKCKDIYRLSDELIGNKEKTQSIVQCYKSSIWDETLYKAWSAIVYKLIPNVQMIEKKLSNFTDVVEATEVLLFERATFLVIAHSETTEQNKDVHRFEKVSNIIKQFKLSCSKMGSHFEQVQVKNDQFAAFIEAFTPNTFIMVVMSGPGASSISGSAILMNIRLARKHFEKLEEPVSI
ncbi:unnamed protein product, partial [Mesorhabditis spiculigera]